MSHQFYEGWSGLSIQKALKRKCLRASSFLSAFEMNTLTEWISVFWSSIASANELLRTPEALLHSGAAPHSRMQFRTHPENGAPVNGNGKCLTLQNCGFRFFSLLFFPYLWFIVATFTERIFSFPSQEEGDADADTLHLCTSLILSFRESSSSLNSESRRGGTSASPPALCERNFAVWLGGFSNTSKETSDQPTPRLLQAGWYHAGMRRYDSSPRQKSACVASLGGGRHLWGTKSKGKLCWYWLQLDLSSAGTFLAKQTKFIVFQVRDTACRLYSCCWFPKLQDSSGAYLKVTAPIPVPDQSPVNGHSNEPATQTFPCHEQRDFAANGT